MPCLWCGKWVEVEQIEGRKLVRRLTQCPGRGVADWMGMAWVVIKKKSGQVWKLREKNKSWLTWRWREVENFIAVSFWDLCVVDKHICQGREVFCVSAMEGQGISQEFNLRHRALEVPWRHQAAISSRHQGISFHQFIQEILIHSLACINCWSKWLGYLREQMDNELCTCGVYNQMKGNREGSKSIINKYINSGSKSITNKYINWGGDLGINVD